MDKLEDKAQVADRFSVSTVRAGPLFLLLGYILWCSVIYCVNEGQGIMVSRIARESAFTRFATSYVDEAFGFATGVNYFIQTCSLLCFEVTALHGVIGFWYDVSWASVIYQARRTALNKVSSKVASGDYALHLSGRLLLATRLVFPMVRRVRILDRFGYASGLPTS